ncbi:MAG: TIGR00730 family Rossman fold protein [Cyclobacteriaceae bacterium]|nr:TIGR00730 family Rossman fold protein [Cyclobacteriaceae bacterium]
MNVLMEFIHGFRRLHFVGPCVTFFGSARFEENHPIYHSTRALAGAVAELGFTVMTGGGAGLMEAANRGAKDVGGRSVGCNISLPSPQAVNRYLDKWVTIRYFFIRKTLLIKYSFAFIVLPGGFGTLDEFFEAVTLTQTKKILQFPIIIFDRAFHEELLRHLDHMIEAGTISREDLELIVVADEIPVIIDFLRRQSIEKFLLQPEVKRLPRQWLFEKA